MSSPRWLLRIQATIWRLLMSIGFGLNSLQSPRPPSYDFVKSFSTGTYPSTGPGHRLKLYFYLPKDFDAKSRKYPVVVNFHGGGFTIGSATDDRRWAAAVLNETTAIFVSVEYRLAPEYPFPICVQDGCEAVLHLAANCEEYGIDPARIALTGFSAGANLAFTVPLMLHDHFGTDRASSNGLLEPPSFRIVSIISFYPVTDFRITRASKRASSKRPEKNLPRIVTNLFDASYMPDPANVSSPFASPSAASDDMLRQALPFDNIGIYCCEWDMLHAEGTTFARRMEELGKKVEYETIPEAVHGFDKLPRPMGVDPRIGPTYHKACAVLGRALDTNSLKASAVI
ncbi:MAG: hypothetical protein LQ350_006669 [Teloschistes chrysophthalmus]|nr:MAG: hypothetical protein LQ350_006669 [Niorma chrysophthalma]